MTLSEITGHAKPDFRQSVEDSVTSNFQGTVWLDDSEQGIDHSIIKDTAMMQA
ncbi:MAG TPA: hypothetical protein VEI80_07110 [Candidatus Acidoferrales bacterium]|nr:hypothetical protein [Candidatus Acidoferrales bacterium]